MITSVTCGLPARHAFLGRTGGVSTGLFTSLNVGLGSSDDPAAVVENRRRAAHLVAPGTRLVTLHQLHSAIAVEAGEWADDARPQADALVTNRPDLVLGILTADCAPVLLADPQAGVVGAAHAGWKGALYGVLESVVAAMEQLGASRATISAAIGPCIGRASYEVGEEYMARFTAVNPDHADFFTPGAHGKAHFDLEGFCAARLATAGVTSIRLAGIDTRADAAHFFSYRRTTLAGEPDYGRQISLIAV